VAGKCSLYNREEWKKLLKTRKRRILHMEMEWNRIRVCIPVIAQDLLSSHQYVGEKFEIGLDPHLPVFINFTKTQLLLCATTRVTFRCSERTVFIQSVRKVAVHLGYGT
jgi:hypothetical protein